VSARQYDYDTITSRLRFPGTVIRLYDYVTFMTRLRRKLVKTTTALCYDYNRPTTTVRLLYDFATTVTPYDCLWCFDAVGREAGRAPGL